MFKNKLNYIFLIIIFVSIVFTGCGVDNTPGDLQNKSEPSATESTQNYNVLADALSDFELIRGSFNDGLLCVYKDTKYGYIDKTGTLVIPCIYQGAMPFSEGLAVVHQYNPDRNINNSDEWGFIDTAGNVVIPIIYDWVGSFRNGRAVFRDKGQHGLMDKSGNITVPAIYYNIWAKDDGTWVVQKDGKNGIIDGNGNYIVPLGNKYRSSEGLFLVEIRDENGDLKYGFADIDDNWIIPPTYNNAELFHEGLAEVLIYDKETNSIKYKFIDKTGAVVLDIEELGYSYCESYFSDGLCLVYKEENKKFGFIDKTGILVIPAIYDIIDDNPFTFDVPDSFHDGRAVVKKDGKFGMIDTAGNIIVPIIYDHIRYFIDNDNYNIYNGTVVARKDGKFGIIDYYTGDVVVPLIYDDIGD